MYKALIRGDKLCSPTVGTFFPLVSAMTPVQPGLKLGRLRRLFRWQDLVAPPGSEGMVLEVIPPYSPVEYGTPIATLRVDSLAQPHRMSPKALWAGLGRIIRAEVEGTLYQRPRPGASPFAPEGSRVRQHDTIALVEVMKTLTPIRAPFSGVLKRWLVSDGRPVSQGLPLAVIEPDADQRLQGSQAS